MILFFIYLSIILFLVYRNNFFGLFYDSVLSTRFYLSALLIKISALVAFYIVYTKVYGTVLYSDTQNFMHDSQILYSVFQWNFTEFVKLMFGVQDDGANTELFQNYLRFTSVWDENKGEVLYNDNRLMLRAHALLHFISGHNYYVHALFSSFAAFIGINWIYKSFKYLFKGKELLFFLSWLVFPGVWFWTSALFKEGPALFIMGMIFISCKRIFNDKKCSFKNISMLIGAFILSLSFKQYLLAPVFGLSVMFFVLKYQAVFNRYFSIVYIGSLLVMASLLSITLKAIKGKGLIELLSERQTIFMDMAHGGIFLLDSTKFVRLPYDTTQIIKTRFINAEEEYVKIKAGASYSYAEHSHQKDTLVCNLNTDTTSEYLLYYVVPKANAALSIKPVGNTLLSFIAALPEVIYITMAKPLFFDSRNTMDLMASVENLIILIALLIFIFGMIRRQNKNAYQVYWLMLTGVVLIIIGITSPNMGAIERYKSLVMPFVLITALYSSNLKDPQSLIKLFKKH